MQDVWRRVAVIIAAMARWKNMKRAIALRSTFYAA
jgi:hypothetical protein